MTIQRQPRLLSGGKTGDKKDRSNAVLNPKMLACQWQKGESGNPTGRPRKSPVSDALRELIDQEYSGREKRFRGLTNCQVLATRLFEQAIAGDLGAAKEVADRIQGKAPQSVTMGGPEGGAIAFMSLSREENEKRIMELLARAGGPDRESVN
jgi:hypothetical protein